MKYFLIGLTFVVSLLLIVVVVGQESKQAGTAIGGGTENAAGGRTRGKDAVLSKFTIVFGTMFAVLCLVLGRYMNTF